MLTYSPVSEFFRRKREQSIGVFAQYLQLHSTTCLDALSFLNGRVADGSVVILCAADVFRYIVAPQEMSTVLLSKVIQLSG